MKSRQLRTNTWGMVTIPARWGAIACLLILLTLYSLPSHSVGLLIPAGDRQNTDSKTRAEHPEDTLLLKKKEKTQTQAAFTINDMVLLTATTELRRSARFNHYNVIRKIGMGETASVKQIKGQWLQVQTEGDEFGWLLASTAKKIQSRTLYTEDWTDMIASNIGAIEACQIRITNGDNTISARVFDIQVGFNDSTILLFSQDAPEKSYRCTLGAYGGEIYRFEAFKSQPTALNVLFTPTPGQPVADACYANEILFNRYRRTLGWLSSRICR